MDSISVSTEADIITKKIADTIYSRRQSFKPVAKSPVFDNLIVEGGENFFNYLEMNGFGNEPNLLVLSSKHHFYYDHNDLKGVKVLVNVRRLNIIKHLDSFLHVIFRVLPPDANFVGCFSDNGNLKKDGSPFYQTRLFYQKFINFLDSRTDRYMVKSEIIELLDSHGFKVIDMTEIDGLTYFTTRNKRNSGE
jgi:hypothetical protein